MALCGVTGRCVEVSFEFGGRPLPIKQARGPARPRGRLGSMARILGRKDHSSQVADRNSPSEGVARSQNSRSQQTLVESLCMYQGGGRRTLGQGRCLWGDRGGKAQSTRKLLALLQYAENLWIAEQYRGGGDGLMRVQGPGLLGESRLLGRSRSGS